MHRFYCNPLSAPTAELIGPEAHHLASVLRLRDGDKVELFDGLGVLATALISSISKKEVTLTIESLARLAPPKPRIIIAASIPKGQRLDWLIEKCTELGIDRLCPVIFERTVRQPGNPAALARWESLAVSAAKQCRRLFLPQIDPPASLADALAALRHHHPSARILFGSLSSDSPSLLSIPFTTDTIALVGPEGGLTDNELSLLSSSSASGTRLTDTILRTESAALAFAAVLAAQRSALQKGTP